MGKLADKALEVEAALDACALELRATSPAVTAEHIRPGRTWVLRRNGAIDCTGSFADLFRIVENEKDPAVVFNLGTFTDRDARELAEIGGDE